MTIDEMVDEWSRMTPTQREFCARLVAVAGVVHPDMDEHMEAVFTQEIKNRWDSVDWPFKFGVSV